MIEEYFLYHTFTKNIYFKMETNTTLFLSIIMYRYHANTPTHVIC